MSRSRFMPQMCREDVVRKRLERNRAPRLREARGNDGLFSKEAALPRVLPRAATGREVGVALAAGLSLLYIAALASPLSAQLPMEDDYNPRALGTGAKAMMACEADTNVGLTTEGEPGGVRVSWSYSGTLGTGCPRYGIHREDSNSDEVLVYCGTGTSFLDDGTTSSTGLSSPAAAPTAGEYYYYKFKSLYTNNDCSTAHSASQTATQVYQDYAVVTATATAGSGQVVLSWTDFSSSDYAYRVERRAAGGTDWNSATCLAHYDSSHACSGGIGFDAVTYIDTDGTAGTAYDYGITVFYDDGNTSEASYSVIKNVTFPGSACVGTAPTSVAVSPSSTGATVSWSGGSLGTGSTKCAEWQIYRYEITSITQAAPSSWATDSLRHDVPTGLLKTDEDAVNGKSYWYAVGVGNDDTNIAPTASARIHPYLRGVTATADATNQKIVLAWPEVAFTSAGYEVRSKKAADAGWGAAVSTGSSKTDTGYDFTGGEASTSYEFQVRPKYSGVSSTWSDKATQTFPASLDCSGTATSLTDPLEVTADGIKLSWTGGSWGSGSTACTKWVVQRADGDGSFVTKWFTETESEDEYLDREPVGGTSYKYRMALGGGTGNTDAVNFSNEVEVDPYMKFTVSAVGEKIVIDWSNSTVTGAIGYDVTVQKSGETVWSVVGGRRAGGTDTSKDHTDGDPGSQYRYRIRAHVGTMPEDVKDWSYISGYVEFPAAAAAPPSAPRNLNAGPNSEERHVDTNVNGDQSTELVLTWDTPTTADPAITHYKIQHSTDAAFPTGATTIEIDKDVTTSGAGALLTTPTGKKTYVHGLTACTVYYVRVAATNSAGTGAWSGTATTATKQTSAGADCTGDKPGKVTDLAGTSTSAPGATITLTWTALSPAPDDYQIEHRSCEGSGWELTASSIAGTAETYTDNKLCDSVREGGGTMTYRITARKGAVFGDPSDAEAVAVRAEVQPSPARNLRATAKGNSPPNDSIYTFRWDAPATGKATNYDLFSSPNPIPAGVSESTLTKVGTAIGSDSLALHNIEVPRGVTTYYQVWVYRTGTGHGDPSNTVTVRPGDTPTEEGTPGPPGKPTATLATDTSSITIKWTAPTVTGTSSVTRYYVRRFVDGSTESQKQLTTLALTYTDTDITKGKRYRYQVRAGNTTGPGSWSPQSDEITVPTRPTTTTPTTATLPSVPRDLTASAEGTTITLIWLLPADTGNASITGYKVEVSEGVGGAWTVLSGDTKSTDRSYEHAGRTPGVRYRYRVSAINSKGTGPTSAIAEVVVGAVTPGAPTGVSATATDKGSIVVAWGPPSDLGGAPVLSYQVELSTDGTAWRILEATVPSNQTSYEHVELEPGTRYYYRVSARNSAGLGTASGVVSVVTKAEPPDPPVGLVAAGTRPDAVELLWQPPSKTGGALITGYRVEFSLDGVGWRLVTDNVQNTQYVHEGLDPATVYYYRVFARNSAGLSDPSRVARVETTIDVPSQPTQLSAKAISPTEITLRWVAPRFDGGSDLTGYKIEVSEDRGVTWKVLRLNTGSLVPAYSHKNLAPGTWYRYRVSAVNHEQGAGPPSEYAEARTFGPPDVPHGLVLDAISPTAVVIFWRQPDYTGGRGIDIHGYIIEYSQNGGDWEVAARTGNVVSYRHDGLKAGTTYRYRVRAFNGIGVGEPSEEAVVTTLSAAPLRPRALVAAPVGPDRIDLHWQEPEHDGGTPIRGYQVEFSLDEEAWQVLSDHVKALLYAHRGLEPTTTYHYRVRAVNEIGMSEPSLPVSATTYAATPMAPRDLTAESEGPYQVNLTWFRPEFDGGTEITGYQVQISETRGASWTLVIENTGSAELAFTHGDREAATIYRYRVAAWNASGLGAWSNEAEVRTDAIAPGVPENVVVEAYEGDFVLTWDPPKSDGGSPIEEYIVEVSSQNEAWDELARTKGTIYTHIQPARGMLWRYRVKAVNEVGPGQPSEIVGIRKDDPIERTRRVNDAILPWFGVAVASSMIESVSERIIAVSEGDLSNRRINLRGARTGLRGLAAGSQIADTNGGLSVWAAADLAGLSDGSIVDFDGEVLSAHGGLDGMMRPDVMVGLSTHYSDGGFDFTDQMYGQVIEGRHEVTMMTLAPYIAWIRDDITLWSTYGKGWGDLAVSDSLVDLRESRIAMTILAAGGARKLTESRIGVFSVRAEGWNTALEVGGNVSEHLDHETSGDIHEATYMLRRARLLMDWKVLNRQIGENRAGIIFQAGMRKDWNNVDTGLGGAEFGSEIHFESPRVRVRGNGRIFSKEEYREWGVRGMVELRSHGLTVQATPAYGAVQDGVQQLWQSGVSEGVIRNTTGGRVGVTVRYNASGSKLIPYGRYDSLQDQLVVGMKGGFSLLNWTFESQRASRRIGFSVKGNLQY